MRCTGCWNPDSWKTRARLSYLFKKRSLAINIWWRHQMETFSALLAICSVNSPVPDEFPAQRPVTRSFDVFLDLRLNKRLSKQSLGWWFETLSRPLWRHRNEPWHWPSYPEIFRLQPQKGWYLIISYIYIYCILWRHRMKYFPRYCPFGLGTTVHRWISLTKGQSRAPLLFLCCQSELCTVS